MNYDNIKYFISPVFKLLYHFIRKRIEMNHKSACITRRNFIKHASLTSAAISAPMIIPSRLLAQAAPSNKITLGFIGMGNQGTSRNLGTFLHHLPETKVLAVCDVDSRKAANAKSIVDKHYKNTDCDTTQDFREVIARKDIDAIVISTPDHWHIPMSLAALKTGKDVFCEKPSLTIAPGRQLVNEVAKRNAVFQWGIEDRYLIKYHRLAGWVRSGLIGDLQTIHVSLPKNPLYPKDKVVPVPKELDYNMWLGPAPFAPYTPSRIKPMNWRMITDYSGGMLTDWGAHLVDTAQIGAKMENSGPVEITGTARKIEPGKYQSDVPVDFKVRCRYSNGVELFVTDGPVDIKFVGTQGWVRCKGWDGTWSASSEEILRVKEFPPKAQYWPRPPIEHKDFINSVKSRTQPIYRAEAGHRLSTTLHLGHIAILSAKTIKWNPKKRNLRKLSRRRQKHNLRQTGTKLANNIIRDYDKKPASAGIMLKKTGTIRFPPKAVSIILIFDF